MDQLNERIDSLGRRIEREIAANERLLEELPEYPPRDEKRTSSGVVPKKLLRKKMGLEE